MPLVVIPQTEAFAYTDETPRPGDRAVRVDPLAYLGKGILRPFRRDEKNDFANAGGLDLVKACVAQILGMDGASPDNPMNQGELRWDPERGAQLRRLRHHANNDLLQAMARTFVVDALARWEPRVRVRGTLAARLAVAGAPDAALSIHILYDVRRSNSSDVQFRDVRQTVNYGGA